MLKKIIFIIPGFILTIVIAILAQLLGKFVPVIGAAVFGIIIGILRSSGIVRSQRGSQGGYILSRPPSDITMKEIFETLEGSINLVQCLEDDSKYCDKSGLCSAQYVWKKLSDSISSTLEAITLDDMVTDCLKQANLYSYEI